MSISTKQSSRVQIPKGIALWIALGISPPNGSPADHEEVKSPSPIQRYAIDSMWSQSNLFANSYLRSRASLDLPPMSLDDDEEKIISPLKV